MKQIGFIGLGIMGLPMAANIVKGMGKPVLGYDVSQDRKAAFEQRGGTAAEDSGRIFQACDVILTCLPTHEIIVDTITAAIDAGKPGTILVDLSSTAPHIIAALYKKAGQAGMHLLDSPVSGGEPGAWAGTLAVMTGGEKAVFDEVKHILDCVGTPVYTGASTTGSVTKLANNLLGGAHLVAIAEAYAFAAKAGLDPEVLFHATRSGFNGGPLYENKIPKLLNRDFQPGGRVAVHRKDILNAMAYAEQLGIEIPLTATVLHVMDWMDGQGLGNLDQIGMIRYYEEKMDTLVERGGGHSAGRD